MSGALFAVLSGAGLTVAAYLAKRVIDYALPPGRHWPLMDRWSRPNDEEVTDEDT